MKIGIITFHNSDNYGAVLQTMALQNAVKTFNEDVEIIDYRCANKKKYYHLLDIGTHKNWKGNIHGIINYLYRLTKYIKFEYFRRKWLTCTPKAYKTSESLYQNNSWDIVITGSDQVWNYINTGFDQSYLLDFVSHDYQKIAYAASFGLSHIDLPYEEIYHKLLSSIKFLSVRESSGQTIVQHLINSSPKVVVDPTMLITPEVWLTYTKPLLKRKEYVLLYTINNSKEINHLADELSQETGYQVIKIATNILDFISPWKIVLPNPLTFIRLIYESQYVLTDSFHGSILSINLNKDFYTYHATEKGSNRRVTDLLESFNLQNRIIYSGSHFPKLTAIDYASINPVINAKRADSLNFLETSLIESIKTIEKER